MTRRRDVEYEEALASLRALWKKRAPFLMQMEVGAPYDGCFREPNIFLVTPPGSAMQRELMGDVPARYGSVRELALQRLEAARVALAHATSGYDWAFRKAGGNREYDWLYRSPMFAENRAEALASLPALFDTMSQCQDVADAAQAMYDAAVLNDPSAMEQPPLYVWPLYASGQGVAMDCVHSLRELVSVCEDESCYALATRDTWPDGLLGSRFLDNGKAYGRITLVDAQPMGPLNLALPAGERYWMHALRVASKQWGQDLTWKCEGCDSVIEYDEYEGRPEATGYHGDGGIGVHYTGVLCDQCLDEGACAHCRDSSGDPMSYYDPKIKEYGWNLCESCTESLLEGCHLVYKETDTDLDLDRTVLLQWWKDPKQCVLPGIKLPPMLRFTDTAGVPIKSLSFNLEVLAAAASEMRLEHLDPGWGHGLALSGAAVENAVCDEESD